MNARTPAEVFPPGEFLKDELDARNWSQIEFAEIIGKDTRLVYEIIKGKRSITPETAIIFSEALGTSPELWMNLESQYQLSKVRNKPSSVSKRAVLHGNFPVRDMVKRGWLTPTDNVDVLESQVLSFFNIKAANETPSFQHAAKKTDYENGANIQQMAWLFRVRKIASEMIVDKYSEEKLKAAVEKLSQLLSAPEECRHVPKILAECGVRYVVVEGLPGSKIDGACFWLDDKSPVIGMTLLRDRIDNFWFVLRHEIEHILKRHRKGSLIIDEDIGVTEGYVGAVKEEEDEANKAGAEFCVPQSKLNGFINRVAPYFSEAKVLAFAATLKIHPGLVVGQLQRRLDKYYLFKQHQVKVKQFITSSAVFDGWGQPYPID